VLVEPAEQELPVATTVAPEVVDVLVRADVRKPVLLHGREATAWPFLEWSGRERFSTRIGPEDTKLLPDGQPAGSNADVVRAAAALLRC
jgi:uncharacterized protein (DUF849 family)